MILKPDAVHKHYRVRWREETELRQQTCASFEEATILDGQKKAARGQALPPVTQRNIRLSEYAAQWLDQPDVAPKNEGLVHRESERLHPARPWGRSKSARSTASTFGNCSRAPPSGMDRR